MGFWLTKNSALIKQNIRSQIGFFSQTSSQNIQQKEPNNQSWPFATKTIVSEMVLAFENKLQRSQVQTLCEDCIYMHLPYRIALCRQRDPIAERRHSVCAPGPGVCHGQWRELREVVHHAQLLVRF
jgi:hypothetical protein